MKTGISILCIAVLATSSAGFVNIQTFDSGVRSLGLGNSFVAVADNTEAVFANPAGLGQLRRRQATYTYGGGIDKKYDNLGLGLGRYMASFGMPLNAKLGLGLGYERLSSSQISENGAFVSLSYQAVKRLYVGVSAKYLFWTVSSRSAAELELEDLPTASWVDVGLLWQSPFPGAQVGLLLKNVYQPSEIKDDLLVLEREVHVGAGYRVGTQGLLSVQYVQHRGTERYRGRRRWMIGGEYHVLKELVLRAGREHQFDGEFGLDGRKERVWLSMGLGLRLEYRAVGLLLDYVHSSNRGILSPHRFSLACEF